MNGCGAADGVGGRTAILPHPTLSRWERAFVACAFIRLGGFIRRWLPYNAGAHGRAPLPRITNPGHCHETRPPPRIPDNITKLAPPPNEKPFPSGRGLGEGETYCTANAVCLPSTPPPFILRQAQDERRLPSRKPQPLTGVLDSGLRRNDGVEAGMTAGRRAAVRAAGVMYRYKIPPTPLLRKGGFFRWRQGARTTPAPQFVIRNS